MNKPSIPEKAKIFDTTDRYEAGHFSVVDSVQDAVIISILGKHVPLDVEYEFQIDHSKYTITLDIEDIESTDKVKLLAVLIEELEMHKLPYTISLK